MTFYEKLLAEKDAESRIFGPYQKPYRPHNRVFDGPLPPQEIDLRRRELKGTR